MLCLLAKNCTEAAYTRLVEALCTEHNIMLMKVVYMCFAVKEILVDLGGR